ncbi:efflux RND transporter periplasmic adaptor subunit [Aureisphaera galaxeae]|uniref:efflux RND transporter periplasmic adaptor subunit n=1 Tax=Aureisphaera galaxeae TaxID=1538023 RepID=UPI0023503749|nr:efflux RND transporter periplasmic adaptor subunit [Aureisphaera galaxeae]MDC8005784.1 efflux RND transporter periplasmic adaptor subunit [Aureisphaera galaxeae]
MTKRTRNIVFVFLGIAAITALLFIGKNKKNDAKEVQLSKIEPITIVETVAATGKIQPEVEVALSSEVSGEIIELPVKEGQQVKKGDLLVKINPDLIQSALSQAQAALQNTRALLAQSEASLRNSELNYNRNKSLFEKGVISKSEWDQSVADFEMAQANQQSAYFNVQSAAANVKQSRDNLSRTSIFAPMDGTISKLSVELGERVVGTAQMAGTEIVRVANLDNMEVEVDVNENDIVKVAIGDSTIVEVDAYLKREFKGLVTEIANSAETALSVDQVTNFKVKVRILPESYGDLTKDKPEFYSPFRPGMTATVDIITEKKEGVIGVPISAIVVKLPSDTIANKTKSRTKADEDKFEGVFIKDGEEASLQVVETGIQDENNIEITSGLDMDQTVITGPYNLVTKTLKSGDRVEEMKEDKDETKE